MPNHFVSNPLASLLFAEKMQKADEVPRLRALCHERKEKMKMESKAEGVKMEEAKRREKAPS